MYIDRSQLVAIHLPEHDVARFKEALADSRIDLSRLRDIASEVTLTGNHIHGGNSGTKQHSPR